jgi:hypothetical protein
MTATKQPNTLPRSPSSWTSTCCCRNNYVSYLAMTISRSPRRAVRCWAAAFDAEMAQKRALEILQVELVKFSV